MVRNLHVQLDDELFKLFKIKCVRDNVKESVAIRRLIERWLSGDEELMELRRASLRKAFRLKHYQTVTA